jgi:hypothetical protein
MVFEIIIDFITYYFTIDRTPSQKAFLFGAKTS